MVKHSFWNHCLRQLTVTPAKRRASASLTRATQEWLAKSASAPPPLPEQPDVSYTYTNQVTLEQLYRFFGRHFAADPISDWCLSALPSTLLSKQSIADVVEYKLRPYIYRACLTQDPMVIAKIKRRTASSPHDVDDNDIVAMLLVIVHDAASDTWWTDRIEHGLTRWLEWNDSYGQNNIPQVYTDPKYQHDVLQFERKRRAYLDELEDWYRTTVPQTSTYWAPMFLAVASSHRTQGADANEKKSAARPTTSTTMSHGRDMVTRLTQVADAQHMDLWIDCAGRTLQRYYERLGFVVVDRKRIPSPTMRAGNDFQEPLDLILMCRPHNKNHAVAAAIE